MGGITLAGINSGSAIFRCGRFRFNNQLTVILNNTLVYFSVSSPTLSS